MVQKVRKMYEWMPFCMRCNTERPGGVNRCHVCGRTLRIQCRRCGHERDEGNGDHECNIVVIPQHPLAVENDQLRAELTEYRRYVANLGCERPVRHYTALDDKSFGPCGECLPCRSHESAQR